MRLVLIAETGTLAGRRFVLEQGSLRLGREDSCDVRFGHDDAAVSRRHAVIGADPDGFRLMDVSSNGTLLNGRPVRNELLQTGDVLQLGFAGPRLKVELETAPEPPPTRPRRASQTIAEARLYHPETDKGRAHDLPRLALVLGMMLAGLGLGLLTALLTMFQLGFGAALVGVVVAFVPAPLYLAIWLWLDRYDPEPAWVLAGAFVWGAGAATFVAGIINTVFQATLAALTSNAAAAELLAGSISAPLAEEALKGLAVLAVFLILRREFDGVIDGIVYAGVVALGFATVENVLYYGKAVSTHGAGLLAVVFVLRGVLGPFSHSLFTSMTGIGCGVARETHNRVLRVVAPILGYLAAVTLHALWNTLAAVSGSLAGHLAVYVLVWAPLFLAFFAWVVYMGHGESRLIADMLQLEVARGALQPEQVRIATSWVRRIGWLLGDPGRFGPRRRFLHATTRLALCYWHASRAQAAGGQTVSFSQVPVFQREIRELLPQI